jgi:hypothetical protein
MDRLHPCLLGSLDDPVATQVGLSGWAWTNVDRLVCHAHVERLGIGIGIDCDRPDPEPPCSSDHSTGNLAAIGDEQ